MSGVNQTNVKVTAEPVSPSLPTTEVLSDRNTPNLTNQKDSPHPLQMAVSYLLEKASGEKINLGFLSHPEELKQKLVDFNKTPAERLQDKITAIYKQLDRLDRTLASKKSFTNPEEQIKNLELRLSLNKQKLLLAIRLNETEPFNKSLFNGVLSIYQDWGKLYSGDREKLSILFQDRYSFFLKLSQQGSDSRTSEIIDRELGEAKDQLREVFDGDPPTQHLIDAEDAFLRNRFEPAKKLYELVLTYELKPNAPRREGISQRLKEIPGKQYAYEKMIRVMADLDFVAQLSDVHSGAMLQNEKGEEGQKMAQFATQGRRALVAEIKSLLVSGKATTFEEAIQIIELRAVTERKEHPQAQRIADRLQQGFGKGSGNPFYYANLLFIARGDEFFKQMKTISETQDPTRRSYLQIELAQWARGRTSYDLAEILLEGVSKNSPSPENQAQAKKLLSNLRGEGFHLSDRGRDLLIDVGIQATLMVVTGAAVGGLLAKGAQGLMKLASTALKARGYLTTAKVLANPVLQRGVGFLANSQGFTATKLAFNAIGGHPNEGYFKESAKDLLMMTSVPLGKALFREVFALGASCSNTVRNAVGRLTEQQALRTFQRSLAQLSQGEKVFLTLNQGGRTAYHLGEIATEAHTFMALEALEPALHLAEKNPHHLGYLENLLVNLKTIGELGAGHAAALPVTTRLQKVFESKKIQSAKAPAPSRIVMVDLSKESSEISNPNKTTDVATSVPLFKIRPQVSEKAKMLAAHLFARNHKSNASPTPAQASSLPIPGKVKPDFPSKITVEIQAGQKNDFMGNNRASNRRIQVVIDLIHKGLREKNIRLHLEAPKLRELIHKGEAKYHKENGFDQTNGNVPMQGLVEIAEKITQDLLSSHEARRQRALESSELETVIKPALDLEEAATAEIDAMIDQALSHKKSPIRPNEPLAPRVKEVLRSKLLSELNFFRNKNPEISSFSELKISFFSGKENLVREFLRKASLDPTILKMNPESGSSGKSVPSKAWSNTGSFPLSNDVDALKDSRILPQKTAEDDWGNVMPEFGGEDFSFVDRRDAENIINNGDGTFTKKHISGVIEAEYRALLFVAGLRAKNPDLSDFSPKVVNRPQADEIVISTLPGKALRELSAKELREIPPDAWNRFFQNLNFLNDQGLHQGDINEGNILWDGRKLRLIDFGRAEIGVKKYSLNDRGQKVYDDTHRAEILRDNIFKPDFEERRFPRTEPIETYSKNPMESNPVSKFPVGSNALTALIGVGTGLATFLKSDLVHAAQGALSDSSHSNFILGALATVGVGLGMWGGKKISQFFAGGWAGKEKLSNFLERASSLAIPTSEREIARQQLKKLAQEKPSQINTDHLNQLLDQLIKGETWAGDVLVELVRNGHPETILRVRELATHCNLKTQKISLNFILKINGDRASQLFKEGFEAALRYREETRKNSSGDSLSSRELHLEGQERTKAIRSLRNAYNWRILHSPEAGHAAGLESIGGNAGAGHFALNVWVNRNTGLFEDFSNSPPPENLFNLTIQIQLKGEMVKQVFSNDPKISTGPFQALVGLSQDSKSPNPFIEAPRGR